MASIDLKEQYARYISALNEAGRVRKDGVREFVQDQVLYNGKQVTRRQYEEMLLEDQAAFEDLIFDVQKVDYDGDNRLAVLIRFETTLVKERWGLQPNPSPGSNRLSFSEDVTYTFEDGKIKAVDSKIDKQDIEQQLIAGRALAPAAE
jgi:predicted ester cyclase